MINFWACGSVSTGFPVFFKALAHFQYEEMGDASRTIVDCPKLNPQGPLSSEIY
jgi:hypothetical protein